VVVEGDQPPPQATFANQTHAGRTHNATWAPIDGGTLDLSALAREVTLGTPCAFALGGSASTMTSVQTTWLALTTSVKIPALAQTARVEATLSARFQTTVQCALVPMATRATLSPNAFDQDEVEFGALESGYLESNEIFYDETYQKSGKYKNRNLFPLDFPLPSKNYGIT